MWGDPRNLDTYTALWNLCVTPAFLAKTTDGSNHPEVLAALRYRVVDLYDTRSGGLERPSKPDGYDDLEWASSPEPVADLEVLPGRWVAPPPVPRPRRPAPSGGCSAAGRRTGRPGRRYAARAGSLKT